MFKGDPKMTREQGNGESCAQARGKREINKDKMSDNYGTRRFEKKNKRSDLKEQNLSGSKCLNFFWKQTSTRVEKHSHTTGRS